MPNLDGLETLRRIKAIKPDVEVIVFSGHGNIETAVKATKMGAYDFLEKPISMEKMLLVIQHALDKQRLVLENRLLRKEFIDAAEIVGQSPCILDLKRQVDIAAPSEGTVLIYGENGTGKELIARMIHSKSLRSDKPFIEMNCAAIPEDLIESELFGHERGSFTGATTQRIGKFEAADKGTLFLDEVGDMSLKTQSKVLRVLEDRSFARVGGSRKISVDVRVIAASNKKLEEEIVHNRFREDLFYRLNVIPLTVPPARERMEDIPLLAEYFIGLFCRKYGKKKKNITPEAMELFVRHPWPGNVRELRNLIERLVIMVPMEEITEMDLPFSKSRRSTDIGESLLHLSLKDAKEHFEKNFLTRKLAQNKGNITKTAKDLNIERSNLHRKIRTYNIQYQSGDS
jgi:two-component system nitrogen regulation response regulator NtrX